VKSNARIQSLTTNQQNTKNDKRAQLPRYTKTKTINQPTSSLTAPISMLLKLNRHTHNRRINQNSVPRKQQNGNTPGNT
jgi:hypothetical protein